MNNMSANLNNISQNAPNPKFVPPEYETDVVDVDSPQDKKAAAIVQQALYNKTEESTMSNNNNEQLTAQDLMALQQMQAMQQQQQKSAFPSTILTGAKYAAVFGAGFLGAKLFFNGGGSSRDAENLMDSISNLFD